MIGPRYQVAVTHGFRGRGEREGATAYVYDRLCDRMVFVLPTETKDQEFGSPVRQPRSPFEVEELARARAAELNG